MTKENGWTNSNLSYEEIKIPVPWGHIAAKWWGSKDLQPIVAIHGWQDNAASFDTLAPYLIEEDISVLCIDLPGHGLSSHYPAGQYYYVFWDGVHILRRIVKYYKWEKISIMGHSLGGGIGFLYSAFYPNEVEKYISIDIASPAVRSPAKMLDIIGDSVDKFLKYETLSPDMVPSYGYDEMIDVVVDAYAGSVDRKSCEILMKRGMTEIGNTGKYLFARDVRLKVAGLGQITIDQATEYAKRIRCEVLNIRASPGLKSDTPEYYDLVLDKIKVGAKRFQLRVVKGTHHLHLTDPESVASIIVDFLKSS